MTDYSSFQRVVKQFYEEYGRHDIPWRLPTTSGSFDPYHIWISEVMLQQTQVGRVVPKYLTFIERYPTVQALASSSLAEVLSIWVGLGYNRRAKFLLLAAQRIQTELHGKFPTTVESLVNLPGIGKNTAGAIVAYAYNQPSVFIETNVRAVYIHHFFKDREAVADTELLPIIAETIDKDNPREWYWALMDYGSYLKSTIGNSSRQSKHHVKQSGFEGSRRQIRGAVIRHLTEQKHTAVELSKLIQDERLQSVLNDLRIEGFVVMKNGYYRLAP